MLTDGKNLKFSTKAETLEAVSPHLKCAKIPPCFHFTQTAWNAEKVVILEALFAFSWAGSPLIVRSSAYGEDREGESQAGRYESIMGVQGRDDLSQAVERVFASYENQSSEHRVLVQPMLEEVALSGVAFSRDAETGGDYIVVSYDDKSGATDTVTSGGEEAIKTYYYWKLGMVPASENLQEVVRLTLELEELFGGVPVDIEFASTKQGDLYLLQVRPLTVPKRTKILPHHHKRMLGDITERLTKNMQSHPFLNGKTTVYGVMPDWNPAEIIGLRPRPLALSLYRDLVTDSVWAYQRHNYGYRNLRSFPLMTHFYGMPYIDVRVSFNSFVPSDIGKDLADRLVNYYIDQLVGAPENHDKIEFEVVFSCYTPDLPERLEKLSEFGFTGQDLRELARSLSKLTNRIIHSETGLWREDKNRISTLSDRRDYILDYDMEDLSKIYWLLEDCKRYGTLPFAGLARAGFIAMQLLRSLEKLEVLTTEDVSSFLGSVDTVTSRMAGKLGRVPLSEFLAEYGHLRPGTYNILTPRYDEAPELYFSHLENERETLSEDSSFELKPEKKEVIDRLLGEHDFEVDCDGLFQFLAAGIREREEAKFLFTRNLSDAMVLIEKLGKEHGLSRDDCSYLDIRVIQELYASISNQGDLLRESVVEGRKRYEQTSALVLPPLITSPEEAWAFHMPTTTPNYITRQTAIGPIRSEDDLKELDGAIVFIRCADPGFDWIFSRNIAGFVTAFGGVNSHMAIRANELNIPALIGVGEPTFDKLRKARRLKMDCASHYVEVLS